MSRPQGRLSEFRISPSPMTPSAINHLSSAVRPKSPSTATTTTTSYSRPGSIAASTAATSTASTRVSIADLLNTQPSAEPPRSHLDSITADPGQPSAASNFPSEEFLNATLDTIRSARGISRPSSAEEEQDQRHRNLISYSNHHEGSGHDPYRGRAYRAARMRRSSQTRQKGKSMQAIRSTSPLMDHASRPSSPHSMPEIGSPALQHKPTRYGEAQLQEWFDDMLGRQPLSSDLEEDPKPLSRPTSPPIPSSKARRKGGQDEKSSLQQKGTSPPPKQDSFSIGHVGHKAVSEPDTQAYAYANDTRQTPYGYIAGDARDEPGPDGNSPRVRIRGRARERGRGPRVRVGSRLRMRELQKSPVEASDSQTTSGDADQQKAKSDPNLPSSIKRSRPPNLQINTTSPRQNLHPKVGILAHETIEVDPLATTAAIASPPRSDPQSPTTVSTRKRRKTNNHQSHRRDSISDLDMSTQLDGDHDAAQLAEIEAARALAERWWKQPLGTAGRKG